MPRRTFTHLDAGGAARMVDVSEKAETVRTATATARVVFPASAWKSLVTRGVAKGSVTGAARIAGVQAAKRTWELIPLCHQIPLHAVAIDFEVCGARALQVTCVARSQGKTGVEMEALVGASVAALTIYDMCKALSKGIRITEVALLEKQGGKSGSWMRPQARRSAGRR